MKKKVLSMLVALVLLFQMVPAGVAAGKVKPYDPKTFGKEPTEEEKEEEDRLLKNRIGAFLGGMAAYGAKENDTFTVTFDGNASDASNVPAAQQVKKGETATVPTSSPIRPGYTFNGWYLDAAGATVFNFSTPITADITLYAGWGDPNGDTPPATSKSFTVTFDLNDGSAGVYRTVSVSPNETVTEPIPNPERELYAFTGWYMESAAVIPYDFSMPVVSDLTLYAGWGDPNGSTDGIYAASNETETIYSISDITVNGRDVIVTYNTNDVALIVVEFFPDEMTDGEWTEENLNRNLALEPVATASGYTEQYGELVTITLPISGTLPEYYLVRASLLDDGHSNINDALATYVTAEYTGTYSRFDAQTVEDFDEDLVINFDEDNTTNFGVMNDSVIVIPADCQSSNNRELVVEDIDDEDINPGGEEYEPQLEELVPDHRFTFPDKDAVISTGEDGTVTTLADLSSGDIIYIEGTTWMFKIKTVTINNDGSISFTQDKDTTMTDFYDVLKVDFEGVEAEESDVMPVWEIVQVDGTGSIPIGGYTISKKYDYDRIELTGSITGKVTGNVKVSYDAHLFSKDYFEATFTFSTEIGGEAKVECSYGSNTDYNHEWKNVVYQVDTTKIKLPTPVTGLEIYIKPAAKIDWSLSGDVSFTWSSKQTSGFKYNSDTGRTDIKKKENTVSIIAKGKAEAKVGPILDIGVELLGGVLSGGVVAEAGAKITAEVEIPVNEDLTNSVDSKHACGLCVNGSANWYATATVKCKYKFTDHFKGDIVSLKILAFEAPITFNIIPGKFFASVINSADSPFGGHFTLKGGECTNKVYRTEFKTQDQNGQDISGAQVSVVKQGQTASKTGVSPYVEYLYEGTYTASASIGGSNVSKTVAVSGNRQTVVLSAATVDTVLEGTVVNANNHNEVIPGASVKVSQGNVVVASATTDSNGRFSVTVPNGSLTVEVYKEFYLPFSSTEIVYEGDRTHPMGQIELASGTGMGGFHGVIRDAVTNEPLEGVTLNLYEGWNSPATSNTSKLTLTTNSNGEFRYNTITLLGNVIIGLPSGNYTLTAAKEGYSDISYNIVIYPGTTAENPEINETMSPEMSDGFYRIVLTWGADPRDLDSHLVADTDTGSSIHVFYVNMNPDPNYANLDTDDTSSYGPETITITNSEGLSNIRYAIHDYTNRSQTSSNALANSSAVVRLYKGNQLLRTFNVPTGYDGTEWDVFAFDAAGNIITINQMSYCSSPSNVLRGENSQNRTTSISQEFLKDYELAK